jgi:hypothetical protein
MVAALIAGGILTSEGSARAVASGLPGRPYLALDAGIVSRKAHPEALPLNPSGAAASYQRHDFFPTNLVEVTVDGVFQT